MGRNVRRVGEREGRKGEWEGIMKRRKGRKKRNRMERMERK